MWDYTRLVQEWDLFTKPYDEGYDPPSAVSSWSIEDIKYSYERREEIFEAGGMAWWSRDDESKVVY